MFKNSIKGPPVNNVTAGGTATIILDAGPTYHAIVWVLTVTKTSPTADASFEPKLSDVLGLMVTKVNTVAKRQHTAQELNEIQTAWSNSLAAIRFSKMDNNFNAVADTTGTNNSVATTTRTSTWVLAQNFAEPSRDSYAARQAFAWPTSWVLNGQIVKTATIGVDLSIPSQSTALSAMGTGLYNLANPAIRAEIITDTSTGSFGPDKVTPVMPVTHWFRDTQVYSSTSKTIRDWAFYGVVQQMSFLCPSANDILTFNLKKNNVTLIDTSKAVNDTKNLDYGWNSGHINTSSGDLAGINWPAADSMHLALDFDDDPTSALVRNNGDILELNLNLTYSSIAASPNIVVISQVWRDALSAT